MKPCPMGGTGAACQHACEGWDCKLNPDKEGFAGFCGALDPTYSGPTVVGSPLKGEPQAILLLASDARGKIERATQRFLSQHPIDTAEREFATIILRYEATLRVVEDERDTLYAAAKTLADTVKGIAQII